MTNLYKTLVWSQLDYCAQIWHVLERMQKNFDKMLPEMRELDKLESLKLFSIEQWLDIFCGIGLIKPLKILKDIYIVNTVKFTKM